MKTPFSFLVVTALLAAPAILTEPSRLFDDEPALTHPLTVPRAEQFWLEAKSNGVRYRIEVALPNSYAEGGGPYPVLVLLDTHYSFLIARNIVDHLSERRHLPELVVVGVGYDGAVDRASFDYRSNRTRDYTPTRVPTGGYGAVVQKLSGGAPRFLDFLEKELVPELERRYRLSEERAVVGHSFGGLFVAWARFERPALFTRTLSVSPSLWYDDHWTFGHEQRFAAVYEALSGRFYMSVGSREHNGRRNMVADLERFGKQIEARRYEGLVLHYEVLDNETHHSVFPRALSNGLRFLFEGS